MELPSFEDLPVAGKRVLLRVDFNVPLKDGQVVDDLRIRAAVPTIEALLGRGAAVICCSHLGRPKGQRNPDYSLAPVAEELAGLLGRTVRVARDPDGPPEDLEGLAPGDVALLENLRFDPREERNDSTFAAELASLADAYVSDAFGAVHRAHASTAAIAGLLPHAAGYLLLKEVEVLSRVTEKPEHPLVVVLGGAKVSDKIGVVRNLLDKADAILIGGAMANTFLAATGLDVGSSRIEADRLGEVRRRDQGRCHRAVERPDGCLRMGVVLGRDPGGRRGCGGRARIHGGRGRGLGRCPRRLRAHRGAVAHLHRRGSVARVPRRPGAPGPCGPHDGLRRWQPASRSSPRTGR